jgi:THAP4-like, heme-binding beta-barrel domain
VAGTWTSRPGRPRLHPLHPDLEPLAFLLGDWAGEGAGTYPTDIRDFRYHEQVRFWEGGKPVLLYTQRTTDLDDGAPLHTEMGFWRPVGPDRVEVVISHPTGHAEVSAGTVDDHRIELATTAVTATATAKEVTAVERTFTVEGDTLTYALRMAAVGRPMTPHLEATLHRS